MKIGVLILVGACGVLVGIVIGYVAGTRLSQAFARLPVTDRSPAAQALRMVDRVAIKHRLARDVLLKEMIGQQGGRTEVFVSFQGNGRTGPVSVTRPPQPRADRRGRTSTVGFLLPPRLRMGTSGADPSGAGDRKSFQPTPT